MLSKIEQLTIFHHADGTLTANSYTTGDLPPQFMSNTQSTKKSFFPSGYTTIDTTSKEKRWLQFRYIIQEAETCPTLESILQQAEITYELVKSKT